MALGMIFSLLPPTFLVIMWIWGLVDYYMNKYYSSKYRPAPVSLNPTFAPEDVSVVVRTLGPHPVFKACLMRWFENNPLEIIICTTEEHINEVDRIVFEVVSEGASRTKIKTMVSEMGARNQLMAGVMAAKGKIIATSDNHIFWSRNYLINMLPCFEDDNVGAAGPPVNVYIPDERHDKISPWEVAATKLNDRGPIFGIVMHVAAKWCWVLAGATGVYRAQI